LAGKTVVAVAAGYTHSMALTSDGQVFTWGANDSGQLGNDSFNDSLVPVPVSTNGVLAGKSVAAIAAGVSHCLALTTDGQVVAWGGNLLVSCNVQKFG
jgi:alpha-tubulin suppressor-like RCC1 family protein